MLRDLEGHEVQIVRESNGHKFTYGVSGYGKTYENIREVEAYFKARKNVLILDYSGSYTEKELREKGFLYLNRIERFAPNERAMKWIFRTNNQAIIVENMADAIYESLHCNGYYQKKLLLQSISRAMKRGNIRISDIVMMLEVMLEEEKQEKTVGNVENIQRLLTRLYPYAEIENLEFCNRSSLVHVGRFVTIIDLSGYPESQRRFLTELFLSLIWREIYRQEHYNWCHVLILDEMQFLSLEEGSALSDMLREGRKRNLELNLSTQYIGHYDASELRALQQTDTMLIFRPTPEDRKRSAQMIDPSNSKAWISILSQLRRGEAVLKGAYRLRGSNKIIYTPIVVRID